MATFQDWKEGDLAIRKNRLCRILRIHFDEYPPHVTVKMLDDGNEIGTEFSKLRHPEPEEIKSMEEPAGQAMPFDERETNNDATNVQHRIETGNGNEAETKNGSKNENANKNDNRENESESESGNDNHNISSHVKKNDNNETNNNNNNNQDIPINENRNKSKTPEPSQMPSRASKPRKHKERSPTPTTASKNKSNRGQQNRRWRYLDDEWQNSMFGKNFFEDFGFI